MLTGSLSGCRISRSMEWSATGMGVRCAMSFVNIDSSGYSASSVLAVVAGAAV
jgi:hypothetical protein